jgi:hypothetical protein
MGLVGRFNAEVVGRFKAEVSKMGYPLMGRAHAEVAWLWRRLTLAAGAQRGQGTVEYVALILLVAVVLAGVVAATKKTNLGSGDIGKAIMEKIKGAIDDVSH